MDTGTVVAFDFGAKRIGVAVGDRTRCIAHPLQTIDFEDNARRMDAIAALIAEWQPACLVVGIPTSNGPQPHPLAARIRRFARRLQSPFGLPVDLVDEHLSSWSASRTLSQAGLRADKQKPRIDAMAACVILETWFEDKQPGETLRTDAG